MHDKARVTFYSCKCFTFFCRTVTPVPHTINLQNFDLSRSLVQPKQTFASALSQLGAPLFLRPTIFTLTFFAKQGPSFCRDWGAFPCLRRKPSLERFNGIDERHAKALHSTQQRFQRRFTPHPGPAARIFTRYTPYKQGYRILARGAPATLSPVAQWPPP